MAFNGHSAYSLAPHQYAWVPALATCALPHGGFTYLFTYLCQPCSSAAIGASHGKLLTYAAWAWHLCVAAVDRQLWPTLARLLGLMPFARQLEPSWSHHVTYSMKVAAHGGWAVSLTRLAPGSPKRRGEPHGHE